MPRGDNTGPEGLGPKTGRAAGYCAGYSTPGFMNPDRGGGFGMGYGRGAGRGRGMAWGRTARWGNYDMTQQYRDTQMQPAVMDEKTNLKNRMQILQEQMTDIDRRLKELDNTQIRNQE